MILKSVLSPSDDRAQRCAGLLTQRISADLKYALQRPIVDTVRRNRAGSGARKLRRETGELGVSDALTGPVSRPASGKTAIGAWYRGSWIGSCLAGRLRTETIRRTTDYGLRTTNYCCAEGELTATVKVAVETTPRRLICVQIR